MLLWIWVVSLIVNLGVLGYMQRSQFDMPNPPSGLYKPIYLLYEQVGALYSVFLTTMLSLAFAHQRRRQHSERVPGSWSWRGFYLALALSLAWNGAFIYYVCLCAFTPDLDYQSLGETLQQIPGHYAWIVNPVVGFYFGSEHA
jgi:hypothetical protein